MSVELQNGPLSADPESMALVKRVTTSAECNSLRLLCAEQSTEGKLEMVGILGLSIMLHDVEVGVAHTIVSKERATSLIEGLQCLVKELEKYEQSIPNNQSNPSTH